MFRIWICELFSHLQFTYIHNISTFVSRDYFICNKTEEASSVMYLFFVN